MKTSFLTGIKKLSWTKAWPALKSHFTRMSTGFTGYSFRIIDIPKNDDTLGYTSKLKEIHIAPKHPIMNELDVPHKAAFVSGVYCHEIMHQLETDFAYLDEKMKSKPEAVRKIFLELFNVVEDPAIEYWAPHYIGGTLLKCLRYMIGFLYENSTPIGKETYAYSQFVNACIHYGDGGFVQGDFTFPEAKECFIQSLPVLDKIITEPSGKVRIDETDQILDITKPLWKEIVKDIEEFKKMIKELDNLLGGCGKTTKENSGEGESSSPLGDTEKDKVKFSPKQSIRKRTAQSLIPKNGQDDSNGPQKKAPFSNSSVSKNLNSEEETSENKNLGKSKIEIPDGENTEETIEYEIGEMELAELCKEIEEESKEIEQDTKPFSEEISNEILDVPELNEEYHGVRCENQIITGDVTASSEKTYASLVESVSDEINYFTKQLTQLIKSDREEKEYRTSGRINIPRYQSSRASARIFEKNATEKNRDDIAVLILVDCSGSMYGKKIKTARLATIGLAESFAKIGIPFKVIGFTSDIEPFKVTHFHFVNWRNNHSDRVHLLKIQAETNNFDGYSIQYAKSLLAQRREEHKIMFVISDGTPMSYYYSFVDGIADTAKAIRLSRKNATVIGVAIDGDIDDLHKIYGQDFLHVKNLKSLFPAIARRLYKEVASW